MATLTLKPENHGDLTQHTPSGGAFNWDNVNDVSPDGDTTHNANISSGSISLKTDLFSYQDPPTGKLGTINSVTLKMTAKYGTLGVQNKVRQLVRPTVSSYGGTDNPMTAVYDLYTDTWATNPQTSAAWSWAEVTATQAGYSSTVEDSGSSASIRVTDQYMIVDFVDVYDPGAYAFATMEAFQPLFVNTTTAYLPPDSAQAVMTALQPNFIQTLINALYVFDPRSRAL